MGLTTELRDAMEEMFGKMKKEMMERLDTFCGKMEERMTRLEQTNVLLNNRISAIEKYQRGDTLEIHNLPVSEKENPELLVTKIAKIMDIEITTNDISTAYRLPVKSENGKASIPRLLVKFTKRKHKRLFYSNRCKKAVTRKQLGFNSEGRIYINEHLTKHQADLYYKAKDAVKENSYKFIWTSDQNIYVRYSSTSQKIMISNILDLSKITKQRNLRSSRTNNTE